MGLQAVKGVRCRPTIGGVLVHRRWSLWVGRLCLLSTSLPCMCVVNSYTQSTLRYRGGV